MRQFLLCRGLSQKPNLYFKVVMRSKPFCLVLLLAVSAAVPAGAQTFQEALASAYQNSPQLMAEGAG